MDLTVISIIYTSHKQIGRLLSRGIHWHGHESRECSVLWKPCQKKNNKNDSLERNFQFIKKLKCQTKKMDSSRIVKQVINNAMRWKSFRNKYHTNISPDTQYELQCRQKKANKRATESRKSLFYFMYQVNRIFTSFYENGWLSKECHVVENNSKAKRSPIFPFSLFFSSFLSHTRKPVPQSEAQYKKRIADVHNV